MVKRLHMFILSGDLWQFVTWFLVFFWMLAFWGSGKNIHLTLLFHETQTSSIFCDPSSVPVTLQLIPKCLAFPPLIRDLITVGKQYASLKKKKQRHSFSVYLPRALCLYLLSPVVGTSVMDCLQQMVTNNLWVLEPFGWGHFRNLPKTSGWPGPFSRMVC